MSLLETDVKKAVEKVRTSRWVTAFTGAGISVESGIPPFRGTSGIWNRYNPQVLEIDYFRSHPKESWEVIRDLFLSKFEKAQPNAAHSVLAAWEKRGLLKALITQNIDNLHHRAGSQKVVEYHGNSRFLQCLKCHAKIEVSSINLEVVPPNCSLCQGLLKPDFVFFGEAIPQQALRDSLLAMERTDCLLIIGTTGEVYPAADLPRIAKEKGGYIIEINPEPSSFTYSLSDLYLPLPAGKALPLIEDHLLKYG
ncbi:MAG: NAD-dependent deacylase [Spirochaetales bacterium]